MKASIVFVLEDNEFLRKIFDKNIKYAYTKYYAMKLRESTHIIIDNIN
jgi:hypothetical protein